MFLKRHLSNWTEFINRDFQYDNEYKKYWIVNKILTGLLKNLRNNILKFVEIGRVDWKWMKKKMQNTLTVLKGWVYDIVRCLS